MTIRVARAGVLISLWLLSACAVRGPYHAPQTAPAALKQADSAHFAARPYDARWWRQFDDPVLEQLETGALGANLDLQVAVARLMQARAVFDETSRDRYPKVTAGTSVRPHTALASTRSGRSICSAACAPRYGPPRRPRSHTKRRWTTRG
jgi:outer membrane protein TolC